MRDALLKCTFRFWEEEKGAALLISFHLKLNLFKRRNLYYDSVRFRGRFSLAEEILLMVYGILIVYTCIPK